MKVAILGVEYEVVRVSKDDHDPKMEDVYGYTEPWSKKIVYEAIEQRYNTVELAHMQEQKTIRHEIVHAFLIESGLDVCSSWAWNEEVVDWIARQLPRMAKAMREVGAVDPIL